MAGGHKNIQNHPNAGKAAFDKHPENINKEGRPRKLLSHLNAELKAKGYERVTSSQVIEAMEYLLNLPEDEIKAIAEDLERPYFFRKVAARMGTKQGYEMIQDTLDRVHGRAAQTHEIHINKLGKDLEEEKYE